MKVAGRFEKVSEQNFVISMQKMGFSEKEAKDAYLELKIPSRATKGSAGYDFFAPFSFSLSPMQSITIPTGIRVKINEGWLLQIFPRSGLGFRFRLQLDNTVGIIDSDYYESDNEGHIFCKITNASNEEKTVEVAKGSGFCQGIFTEYGITDADNAYAMRNGGFGSTTL
ncbi:deoxyuridine 5'-triphosphate nucleotidohydrolase [bacterium]|nr:deoxyuridine 5'-triphosphate nucleotidohydrolase [bacterium]